jgi:hypothetical protein
MKGETMSTPEGVLVDRATAWRELESYIFGGRFGRRTVPTRIDPRYAEEFIRQRLDRSKNVTAFMRARRVADYYDLHTVADHFDRLLTRDEKDTKQFGQSLECLQILATVGGAGYSKKVNEYFEYLVQHKLADENYASLVGAVEVLEPGGNLSLLSARLTESIKALQVRRATERAADDEYERLSQLLENDLPRHSGDLQLRQRVLSLTNPPERIEQLCRLYLGWAESDSIELTWWAARQIRREVREQRQALVAVLLRKVLSEVEDSDLDEAEKAAYRVRGWRAISFLGEKLNVKEQRALAKAKVAQLDVLDREFE